MHINAHLDIDLIALDEANHVTCLLELTAPSDEATVVRPGRTLVIVLDRSGSMRGEPIEAARSSIEALTRRLGQHDRFGVVIFDNEAEVAIPIRAMADQNLDALLHAVRSIEARGSTNLSSGYLLALRETKESLAASSHTSATVLLLSDGHANDGILDPQSLHDVARSAVGDSIITSTVGLGLRYVEHLLGALTRGGTGNHRVAATIDEAAAEIAQTVSDLLDVSVVAATVRIVPDPDVVNSVTVRHDVPNWADERSIVVSLGDLYAGEQRRILVQLGVEAVRELGTRTIADIQVQFTTAADFAEHRITMPLVVNVVPGDEARGAVPNPVVEVERLKVEVDEAKNLALESLRNSDSAGAQQAIADAVRTVSAKQAEAAAIDPTVAARLDDTLEELRDFELSFRYESEVHVSKMMMESAAASQQGKASRAKRRPRQHDSQ